MMPGGVLVSVQWLKQNADNPKLKIVDGTWHNPAWNRNAHDEYINQRIEGAVWFNLDEIQDKSAPNFMAIPSTELYKQKIEELGISNGDHVIVYDNNQNLGMFSAPRVWYMFKLFGHKGVSILDGGLPKWLADGGKVVSGPPPPIKPSVYNVAYRPELYFTYEQTFEKYLTDPKNIVDARPPGRFNGTDPEPNPNLPSGHITGSSNVFAFWFLNNDKTFKSPADTRKEFAKAGVDVDQPLLGSCGSGLTACWVSFAGAVCGKDVPVFIGSWPVWYKTNLAAWESMVVGVKGTP